jgi:anti-anti-sigma regulatory factor
MTYHEDKAMNAFARRLVLTIALFTFGACAVAGEDTRPSKTGAVQTIKVSGTDLTGLNASSLTSLLRQVKQQGTTTVVVDMGSVSHMTPAGMESLSAGAQIFGSDNFAVANLSAQPAELAQSEGVGRFRTFPSVEEAIAAFKK